MAITGIAIVRHAESLRPGLITDMLSATEGSGGRLAHCEKTNLAQLGAVSDSATTSTWVGNDLIVVCDASLVDLPGLREELGLVENAPAAEIIGRLYRQFG